MTFMLKNNKEIEENEKLTAIAKRRLLNSKSENTIRAYESDWNNFVSWCNDHDEPVLPTTPETIVNYINDLADSTKANTVSRHVTAISENHIAAGIEPNPAKDNMVRATVKAIRREKGTYQQGKAPVLIDTLRKLVPYFGDDIVSIRDKAMILLGFAGAFRRSELARIRVEEIDFTPEGMTIFIPHSKGDQEGHGSIIAIPYAPDPVICAVCAVQDWLSASHIMGGPLFRGFKKNLALMDNHVSDKTIVLAIKKYVRMAGLDESSFSGHSLRRGLATTAAQYDVDTLTIMRQTRHKSEKMVHRYIDQGNMFKDNVLTRIYEVM